MEFICYDDVRANRRTCTCGHIGTAHFHSTHDETTGEYTPRLGCTKCNDCPGFAFADRTEATKSELAK